jgi:hypothetical protein
LVKAIIYGLFQHRNWNTIRLWILPVIRIRDIDPQSRNMLSQLDDVFLAQVFEQFP